MPPHTHECARRWADLDLLGHVNNVRYLDYVTEARDALLPGSGRGKVAQHRVSFVAPMTFSRRPVLVDSWVTGYDAGTLGLAHEVYDEHEGRRTVHLRASTDLAFVLDAPGLEVVERCAGTDHEWRPLEHEVREPRSSYPLEIRVSDVDERGIVGDARVFELLQESRVRYVMDLHTRGQDWTQHVVARTDVRYLRPIERGRRDLLVHSCIGRVGTSSFTICAEIRDGASVLVEATVVMVTFDTATQRSAPMASAQRDRLLAETDH